MALYFSGSLKSSCLCTPGLRQRRLHGRSSFHKPAKYVCWVVCAKVFANPTSQTAYLKGRIDLVENSPAQARPNPCMKPSFLAHGTLVVKTKRHHNDSMASPLSPPGDTLDSGNENHLPRNREPFSKTAPLASSSRGFSI